MAPTRAATTRRRGALAALVALVAVVIAGGGSPAAACRCVRRAPPVADTLTTVSLAVRVRVAAAANNTGLERTWPATVVAAYRGCFPPTVQLISPKHSCGARMAVGTELLLLPRPGEVVGPGAFRVALCDWSRQWGRLTPADRAALEGTSDQVCPARRPGGYY